jgi:orotidine-5'-phosphate decarboxylase
MVNRHGGALIGKCGYSQVAALAAAGNSVSLRELRSKYNRVFLLVDGLDYPSGNAKNCSLAFDRFGHGAVVCAGPSITGAWREAGSDGKDYVEQAVAAAERMKKNILRYINIL